MVDEIFLQRVQFVVTILAPLNTTKCPPVGDYGNGHPSHKPDTSYIKAFFPS